MSVLALSWAEVAGWLGSVGFGVVSAVVPVANAEAYVVAASVSTSRALWLAIAVGIGQTVGKTLLFLGVRRGRELPVFRRHATARRSGEGPPPGPVRRQARRLLTTLLALVGTKRWGLPIVFLAASLGLPPVYAVALLAGATAMALHWFVVVVLAGRVLRFVLLGLGVGEIVLMF